MRAPVLVAALLLAGCARLTELGKPEPPVPPRPTAAQPLYVPRAGSLWHPEYAANYQFTDTRARFPGDLLTVLVDERAKGSKDATTEASGSSSMSASVQEFFGVPASALSFLPSGISPESLLQAENARDLKGDATTERSDTLTASVTVTVTELLANGNLRVQGEKIVTVNEEDQHIVLHATVRPEDVAPDNTVSSARLADAWIGYYGVGIVADKQRWHIAQRLFDWLWPF